MKASRTLARGVYVHVPYCRRRCPYCDFYFEVGAATDGFVPALARELERRRQELVWPAQTLSLGGGTPSQLPVRDLAQIVDGVARLGLVDGAEVSLEVNPEDIDDTVAAGLKAAGFTRVSVGLQSFDDAVLSWLGRAHDHRRGLSAVESLVRSGLDVGVDLIVGVPGEDLGRLKNDVETAAAAGVVHVSTYVLTVEEGTPLVQLIRRGAREAVNDDRQADAYEAVLAHAAAAGYAQYEVSSHARPGKESRHNRLYWQRGSYLGLGPGAHSFRIDDDGRAIRRHTTAGLAAWQQALVADIDAAHDVEILEPAHALREAIAFGLRDLGAGVDVAQLAALHHADLTAATEASLQRACERGDVVSGPDRRLRLTARGARFADRVARDVLGSIDDEPARIQTASTSTPSRARNTP
jgi:oxygen-independent coproporphyrinogen-3 oxidase